MCTLRIMRSIGTRRKCDEMRRNYANKIVVDNVEKCGDIRRMSPWLACWPLAINDLDRVPK
jgi:hypothetical protein